MSGPPPPRYRVIERGRRLITVDTWTQARIGADPPRMDRVGSNRVGVPRTRRVRPPQPTAGDAPARIDPRSAGDRVAPGKARPWRAMLVDTVTGGNRDGNGRPIVSTLASYDALGPRDIALSPQGVQRLGRAIELALWAALTGIVLLFIVPALAIFIVAGGIVLVVAAGSSGRPGITRWLSGLGDAAPNGGTG